MPGSCENPQCELQALKNKDVILHFASHHPADVLDKLSMQVRARRVTPSGLLAFRDNWPRLGAPRLQQSYVILASSVNVLT